MSTSRELFYYIWFICMFGSRESERSLISFFYLIINNSLQKGYKQKWEALSISFTRPIRPYGIILVKKIANFLWNFLYRCRPIQWWLVHILSKSFSLIVTLFLSMLYFSILFYHIFLNSGIFSTKVDDHLHWFLTPFKISNSGMRRGRKDT